MSRRFKVLMSAYACEPGKGSEPEAGWQWATRLARAHDVTVVTRTNNEASIRAGLAALPLPHPSFIFLDLPQPLLRWKQVLSLKWYYVLWQAWVAWKLRSRLGEFDLVHHATFNSYRCPGFWWFSRSPVLLGPLGGGQVAPFRLLPLFGFQAPWELARSVWIAASRWNPLHWLNCRKAEKLLIANEDTLQRIPRRYHAKVQAMLDVGVEADAQADRRGARGADGLTRLIWVGVLEKRKGLPLALRALAQAAKKIPTLRLTVIGAGPDEAALKQLAQRLGLEARVDWRGRLPRQEVGRQMSAHDVFLFTSVRDTSGNVLLEAMLAELPVITLNHQGAAEMTTADTALRIPPVTISQTVADLAGAVIRLAEEAPLREALGRAGRQRVLSHYTWERKAAEMERIYRELLELRSR